MNTEDARRAYEADVRAVSQLVDEFTEIAAAEAALHARRVSVLARAMGVAEAQKQRTRPGLAAKRDMPLRWIAAELAAAVRASDRSIQRQIDDASQLSELFSDTVAALAAGRVSKAHAAVILDAGAGIDDPEVRAAFEQVVIAHAETHTPGRTRAFARQLAEQVNPRSIDERFAHAQEHRKVWVTELDDGMAQLTALLPVTLAYGILDRLTRQGKAIRKVDGQNRLEAAAGAGTAGADAAGADAATADAGAAGADAGRFDERSLDQIRADLVADMLLTGSPVIDPLADRSPGGLGAIRASVQLTIPITTASGVTDRGAALDGVIPVDSETARRLAGGVTSWERVMTHPITAMVLAVDNYELSAAQKRFLDARDVHCRYPGCRMPARRCDHDHTVDYAHGGRTEICNLACFCKRHHTMKHATDWTVRQLGGGALEWTSPTGRAYQDDPPRRVMFVPEGDPPPF